jgi:hypothetical protein
MVHDTNTTVLSYYSKTTVLLKTKMCLVPLEKNKVFMERTKENQGHEWSFQNSKKNTTVLGKP